MYSQEFLYFTSCWKLRWQNSNLQAKINLHQKLRKIHHFKLADKFIIKRLILSKTLNMSSKISRCYSPFLRQTCKITITIKRISIPSTYLTFIIRSDAKKRNGLLFCYTRVRLSVFYETTHTLGNVKDKVK